MDLDDEARIGRGDDALGKRLGAGRGRWFHVSDSRPPPMNFSPLKNTNQWQDKYNSKKSGEELPAHGLAGMVRE
jgi:hypothetical protein